MSSDTFVRNETLPAVLPEIKAILADLNEALKLIYGAQAPRSLLYGSYARGEADASSDIDVVLLYPAPILPGQEIRRISPILSDLNLRYHMLISVVPVYEEEYHCCTDSFWLNVKREGVFFDAL